MKPKIIRKKSYLLEGLCFYGDPFSLSGEWTEKNEIGNLWKRFLKYLNEKKTPAAPTTFYEIHFFREDEVKLGFREVFVGYEIQNVLGSSLDFVVKRLPPIDYALFTVQGRDIKEDWFYKAVESWLPENGCETAAEYSIQIYDSRFSGMDHLEPSKIDVCFPVVVKE